MKNDRISILFAALLAILPGAARAAESCADCHGDSFVDGFYKQYDSLVVLYNDKFAKPSKAIMDELAKDEHVWQKGLSAKEAEALRKYSQDRYKQ